MEAKFSKPAVITFVSFMGISVAGFCIWFFSSLLFTTNKAYMVIFPGSVAGLTTGSSVTYHGIPIGSITSLDISEKHNNKILATLALDSKVKIKQDTYATLSIKGITGQMILALEGGSAHSPVIKAPSTPAAPEDMPIIKYQESLFTQLTKDVPAIVDRIKTILDRCDQFLGDQNESAFGNIMKNLDKFSKEASKIPVALKNTLAEIDSLIANVKPVFAQTSEGINALKSSVSEMTQPAESFIRNLHQTTHNLNQVSEKLNNQGLSALLSSSRSL